MVECTLDNPGDVMWGRIPALKKSLMIQKVSPILFYYSLLFLTGSKLIVTHLELNTNYENA